MAGRCNSSSCHTFSTLISFSTRLLILMMVATTPLLMLPLTLDAAPLLPAVDCHRNYSSHDWTHPCGNRDCNSSAPTKNGATVVEMLEREVMFRTRQLIRKYEKTRITDTDVQTQLRTKFIESQQTDGSYGMRLENVTQLNASALGHLAYELLSNLTIRVDIATEYEQNAAYPSNNIDKDFKDISDQLHHVLCHVIQFVGKCGRPDALVMLGLDGFNDVCSRRAAEYAMARETVHRMFFDYKVLLAVESVSDQLKVAFASTRH